MLKNGVTSAMEFADIAASCFLLCDKISKIMFTLQVNFARSEGP